MTLDKSKDAFGTAVSDYYNKILPFNKHIKVFSSIAGEEKISVAHLFRNYKKMPLLEKKAIDICSGKVLDIGACSGSHSLELQKRQINVTALEISPLCCDVMKKRGVKNVVCADIFKYTEEQYNTLLLLMNGIGLAGNLEGLRLLLKQLKALLLPEGKIVFDSSDIDYAYYEEDGSKWVDLNNEYYGQVEYQMQFENAKSDSFQWLFIDADTLQKIAEEEGFVFKLLAEGDHYNYLGVLTPLD